MSESPLETKFHLLRDTIEVRNRAISDIRAQIMALEKQMEEVAEPYESEIATLHEQIQAEVKEAKSSYKCPWGKATYRKEYERASWDDKKLQGFALAFPDILEARKVTTVQASVSISVGVEQA
jgi:N-methylhydantoinase B/oxoprolinase/acetone carboxylase alpha subunit